VLIEGKTIIAVEFYQYCVFWKIFLYI